MSPIRHITHDDIGSLADNHYDAFLSMLEQSADQERLDELKKADFLARWESRLDNLQSPMYVLEEKGRLKGFVLFGGKRDKTAMPEDGEIYMLHDFDDDGKGETAQALMETALGHLSYMGYARASVWLPKENKNYTTLFSTYGFEPDGRERIEKQEGLVFTSVHHTRRLGNDSETAT